MNQNKDITGYGKGFGRGYEDEASFGPDQVIYNEIYRIFLQEERLPVSNIKLEVIDNEVILLGSVESSQQRQRVEELVRSVDGVKTIVDRLKINSTNGSR